MKKKNKLPDGITEDMLKGLILPKDQFHGAVDDGDQIINSYGPPGEKVIGCGSDIIKSDKSKKESGGRSWFAV